MGVTVGSGAGTAADGAGIVAVGVDVGVGLCVGAGTAVGGRSGTRITNGVLVGYGVAVGWTVAVGARVGSAACVGMAVGAGSGTLVVHAAMMDAARVATEARVVMGRMRLAMPVLAGSRTAATGGRLAVSHHGQLHFLSGSSAWSWCLTSKSCGGMQVATGRE